MSKMRWRPTRPEWSRGDPGPRDRLEHMPMEARQRQRRAASDAAEVAHRERVLIYLAAIEARLACITLVTSGSRCSSTWPYVLEVNVDRRVLELVLHVLEPHALRQQDRRGGMTQVVEAAVRQPRQR